MNEGQARIEDLRQLEGWRAWVARQDREVRESLALASHQFVEKSDTIYIVFEYRALSSLSAEICERLVSLIWAHYKVSLVEWADKVLDSEEVGPVEREMLMPNIAVEIAPPTAKRH
jgi:hypothetical protein